MAMRLHGGPANGKTLEIARTPIILRVTVTEAGEVDCLNDPDDVARLGESLYVYRLRDNPTRGIMCSRGRGGRGCVPFADGDYEWLEALVPGDSVLRDNRKWAAWCGANIERLMPAWMGEKTCE